MLHQMFVYNWIAEQLKALSEIDITHANKIDSHERLQELIARCYIALYSGRRSHLTTLGLRLKGLLKLFAFIYAKLTFDV